MAEYLAIARELKDTDSPETYRKVNQLSWELAMWLPDHLYKSMVNAVAYNNDPLKVVVAVRKHLLGNMMGDLTSHDIGYHAPGIGKQ